METENRLVDAYAEGWEQGLNAKKHNEISWGDRNVLKLNYGDGCTTLKK